MNSLAYWFPIRGVELLRWCLWKIPWPTRDLAATFVNFVQINITSARV